jgi:ElaB/YqjD/DUF883 family membrane-anchored ribosome-binding protein
MHSAAKKVGRKVARKSESALAVVAHKLHSGRRVAKRANTAMRGFSSRTRRFVKRNPGRVLVGAAVIGFVLAKLGRMV